MSANSSTTPDWWVWVDVKAHKHTNTHLVWACLQMSVHLLVVDHVAMVERTYLEILLRLILHRDKNSDVNNSPPLSHSPAAWPARPGPAAPALAHPPALDDVVGHSFPLQHVHRLKWTRDQFIRILHALAFACQPVLSVCQSVCLSVCLSSTHNNDSHFLLASPDLAWQGSRQTILPCNQVRVSASNLILLLY